MIFFDKLLFYYRYKKEMRNTLFGTPVSTGYFAVQLVSMFQSATVFYVISGIAQKLGFSGRYPVIYIFVIAGLFAVFNYFRFVYKKKYLEIVEEIDESGWADEYTALWITAMIYIVLTLVSLSVAVNFIYHA